MAEEYVIHDGYKSGYVESLRDNGRFRFTSERERAMKFTDEEIDAMYQSLSLDHPLSETSIIEISDFEYLTYVENLTII